MYDFVTQYGPLWGALASVGQILGFMVALLLSLAFLLLMDRKVWAAVQMRKGPNVRSVPSACCSPSRTC
jgi:NADH-quinone oxidoreductase subunit H